MDEIHTLTKPVQARLMKAIQTNENNKMKIRPVGSTNEIELEPIKLIFATNKTIKELRDALLPDFYDRIVQYVIKIPPLRETREDIEKDWEGVWKRLKFGKDSLPKDPKLIAWLKELELNGNYRDLQKIAMNYRAFTIFEPEDRKKICQNLKIPCDALSYTKTQFELYHKQSNSLSPTTKENVISVELDINNLDAKSLQKKFRIQLLNWAKKNYKTNIEIAEALKMTPKQVGNWEKIK